MAKPYVFPRGSKNYRFDTIASPIFRVMPGGTIPSTKQVVIYRRRNARDAGLPKWIAFFLE